LPTSLADSKFASASAIILWFRSKAVFRSDFHFDRVSSRDCSMPWISDLNCLNASCFALVQVSLQGREGRVVRPVVLGELGVELRLRGRTFHILEARLKRLGSRSRGVVELLECGHGNDCGGAEVQGHADEGKE